MPGWSFEGSAAALMLLLSLPLLAWFALMERCGRRWQAGHATRRGLRTFRIFGAGEFAFGQAIEAYEELIDAVCAAGRA